MVTIRSAAQLRALVESLGQNEAEHTAPLTIERTSEDPDVLTIRYCLGTPDEVLEHVHDDGRISS